MVYRTSVSDPFLRLVSFVVVAFLGMVLVFSLIGLYSLWVVACLYILVMFGLSFALMKIVSTAVAETELFNDKVRVKWIKQNLVIKYADEEILFSDVEEDGYTTSRISRTYTLFMKNGREFSYKQFNMYTPSHDNLETMGRDIRESIEKYYAENPEPWKPEGYNKKHSGTPIPEDEKSSQSMRLLLTVFSIIAIYLLVGFPVLKMMFPSRPLTWELKMLAIFTGVILLLSKAFGSIYDKRNGGLPERNDLPGNTEV